jgi:hypothetical protein
MVGPYGVVIAGSSALEVIMSGSSPRSGYRLFIRSGMWWPVSCSWQKQLKTLLVQRSNWDGHTEGCCLD